MIGAVDRWIGKALFVPLIVRFCQRTGMTQFAVYRLGWWMAALLAFYVVAQRPDADVSGVGLYFAVAVVLTVGFALRPDKEVTTRGIMRKFMLLNECCHIAAHVTGYHILLAGPNVDASCPFGLIVLFAEYAATIKTIPPLESERPETIKHVVGEVV